MKINEVEKRVKIDAKTIRYYESEGLLRPAREEGNHYRNYKEEDVVLLKRIKLLRGLGVPVAELRMIVGGERELSETLSKRKQVLQKEKEEREAVSRVCDALLSQSVSFSQLDADRIVAQTPALQRMIEVAMAQDTTKLGLDLPGYDKIVARLLLAAYLPVAVLSMLRIIYEGRFAGFQGGQILPLESFFGVLSTLRFRGGGDLQFARFAGAGVLFFWSCRRSRCFYGRFAQRARPFPAGCGTRLCSR